MTDRVVDPPGPRTPFGSGQEWPQRVGMALADGLSEAPIAVLTT